MIRSATELAREQDYPPEVAEAVYAHARDLGTLEHVQQGRSAWPHRLDAQQWYDSLPPDSPYRPKRKG